MSENPQYDNTDSISLLAPIDTDLHSQQELDETIDAQPVTKIRDIGAQLIEKITKQSSGFNNKDKRRLSKN